MPVHESVQRRAGTGAHAFPDRGDPAERRPARGRGDGTSLSSWRRYMKNPVVHAKVLVRLGVLGEVGHPGTTPIAAGSVVSDALMAAGGPTKDAKFTSARIERDGKGLYVGNAFQRRVRAGHDPWEALGLHTRATASIVPGAATRNPSGGSIGILAGIPAAIIIATQLHTDAMRILSGRGRAPELHDSWPRSTGELVKRGVEHVIVTPASTTIRACSALSSSAVDPRRPDHNLRRGIGSHAQQTAAVNGNGLEPVVVESRPDLVLTYGDVNSTVAAGARRLKKLQVRVGHVEAGLPAATGSMPRKSTGWSPIACRICFSAVGDAAKNASRPRCIAGDDRRIAMARYRCAGACRRRWRSTRPRAST